MSLDSIFTLSPAPTAPPGPVAFNQLTGPRVIVRPYNPATDAESLFSTTNESTFQWMPFGPFNTLDTFTEAIAHREATYSAYTTHVFIDRSTSRIIGSAAYMHLNPTYRTVEIGCIWMGKEWQGKGLALEAVALMEWQAFNTWNFVRVHWQTHHLNVASQKLAEKAGMVLEGKFRKQMYYKWGFRCSFHYAVIDDDWKEVEGQLLEKLTPTVV
ncbi:hypothetical protein HDV00_006320 [Rhizophlyctis rosea]|nr:hypothetical protein HDV00_006320 [Rhizophlyctis rosea]